jgi:hypothetical protein
MTHLPSIILLLTSFLLPSNVSAEPVHAALEQTGKNIGLLKNFESKNSKSPTISTDGA